jgi:hypothetical protein
LAIFVISTPTVPRTLVSQTLDLRSKGEVACHCESVTPALITLSFVLSLLKEIIKISIALGIHKDAC